jgi:23S rRNA (cytidine1920-2'-O)/16S rRNA (cytidine1409-2'-O)-methyltransferase
MEKERLDVLLVQKGLAESRNSAQRLIMAGLVLVDGLKAHKPSDLASAGSDIRVKQKQKYVSRGGEKLEKALQYFGFDNLEDKTCVDVGASTGGFTDCLLKHGAEKVYCIDVGYGQLHARLRNDPRVVIMERMNVRKVLSIPEQVDLVTIDVSFISLKIVVQAIRTWFTGYNSNIIALIKPQFEVGREIAAKTKGVIRDNSVHKQVIEDLETFFMNAGFMVRGITESPILGPKGNKEFLIHLSI